MNCLSCTSITTKTTVLASLAHNNHSVTPQPSSSSTTPPVNTNPTKPPLPRIRRTPTRRRTEKQSQSTQRRSQQPTVIQIERAIGTGVFRDNEPLDFEERKSVFDGILPGARRKFESPIERKLRETGEWMVDQSERSSRSASGKGILVAVFQWILPAWVLLLLVTSGVIKLPFNIPALDNLIM